MKSKIKNINDYIDTFLVKYYPSFINKESFKVMKKSAVLINTSRGKIVNEKDLISALSIKQIRGAALDVYASEPLAPNNKLFNLDNVFLSPHISGNFSSYQEIMIKQFGDMLIKFSFCLLILQAITKWFKEELILLEFLFPPP